MPFLKLSPGTGRQFEPASILSCTAAMTPSFLLCADTALTFGGAFPCLPCNPNAAAVKSRS